MSVLTIRSYRRYALRLPIQFRKEGRKPGSGLLIELSQQGARISNLSGQPYRMGDEVTIATDCGQELGGVVRWSHDGIAGIRLTRSLHLPELNAMLDANRKTERVQLYG